MDDEWHDGSVNPRPRGSSLHFHANPSVKYPLRRRKRTMGARRNIFKNVALSSGRWKDSKGEKRGNLKKLGGTTSRLSLKRRVEILKRVVPLVNHHPNELVHLNA